MIAHELQNFGQIARRERAVGIVEGYPVLVREDRDLQRIAGDHLQAKKHVAVAFPQRLDHLFQIENSLAEGDFGEQEALGIAFEAHVFYVAEDRQGSEQPEGFFGSFAKREIVAEVETHSHIFAAEALEPGGLLRRAPAFVILDGQSDAVFAQDGFGQAYRQLILFEAAAECFEGVELLVTALRQGCVEGDRARLFCRFYSALKVLTFSFFRGSGTLKITRMW